MLIGERLQTIANLVPPNARIADIGTDHAYLPAYLVQAKRIAFAVAGEVNEGPFCSAQRMIARLGLENWIDVRFGNGLEVVVPGEVDTIVIAGMGGGTIVEILSARPAVVAQLQCMILQPMIAAALVRRWLTSHGWLIYDEALVEDDGRLYEIIAAKPGTASAVSPVMEEVGEILWTKRDPLLGKHLQQLIKQKSQVLEEMGRSAAAKQSDKYSEYEMRLAQLEAMACQLAAE